MIFTCNFIWKCHLISYQQFSRACFATKKTLIRRNNFAYNNEFRKMRDVDISENIIVFPNKLEVEQHAEKLSGHTSEKKRLSPLKYKGEILFGLHPVYLALREKRRNLHQLFLRTNNENPPSDNIISQKEEIRKMADSLEIPVSYINTKGLKYLAPGVVHQGVCLDVGPLPLIEWMEAKYENPDSKAFPLWLVLNEILDPMNVGAIVRSAHYFGVNKLFVVRGNSCKLSPTVSKASSGVLETLNIYQIETLEHFIQARKQDGWNILSTGAYCEASSSTPVINIAEMEISKPTILILGNEGRGIPQDIQKLCDSFVCIFPAQNLPQGIDSLNVSVAAGVILYSLATKLKSPS